MNHQQVVVVRIPELGALLGKLVTGTGRRQDLPLEDIRLAFVTAIIAAAGDARRLAAQGELEAALEAVGPAVWQAAWDRAVSAIAERLVEQVEAHFAAEARAVRLPRRLRRRLTLGAAGQRTFTAQLGVQGAQLVAARDALERHAAAARTEFGFVAGALDQWQGALEQVARRSVAAWLELEEAVDAEVARQRAVADRIAAWRRPWWPVLLVGAVVMTAAVWVGLILGGYVASPEWFSALWRTVFSS